MRNPQETQRLVGLGYEQLQQLLPNRHENYLSLSLRSPRYSLGDSGVVQNAEKLVPTSFATLWTWCTPESEKRERVQEFREFRKLSFSKITMTETTIFMLRAFGFYPRGES